MRFHVLTVSLLVIHVFCDVVFCCSVSSCHSAQAHNAFTLMVKQSKKNLDLGLSYPADEGTMILQIIMNFSSSNTASHPRRLEPLTPKQIGDTVKLYEFQKTEFLNLIHKWCYMAYNCQLLSSNTNTVKTPEIYLHKIMFYISVFINGMYFIYWPY